MNGAVSVIIPARNEEHNIEGAVRSAAGQADAGEIILVDDQSSDGTRDAVIAMTKQFPRLRLLESGPLPDGWMGKAHACFEGARAASADWLLFTDADTRHLPGSLAALLARAQREGADLLSISPGQQVETWWEKAVIPLVYVKLARMFRFDDVNDPASPAAAANGQYLLIRRAVYEAIGGWSAVRGAVLDDVALARRVKQTGYKILFLPGAAWARTRMYRRFGEMWRGWTKNLFLLYGGNRGKVLIDALRLALVIFLPYPLLICAAILSLIAATDGIINAALISAMVALVCAAAAMASERHYRRQLVSLGFSGRLALYLAPGALLLSAILASSAWAWRRGGRIQWKGRFYPAKGGV